MTDQDYGYEYNEEDREWQVYNMTKWGRKGLMEVSGPGAEAWAKKYYEWLQADRPQCKSCGKPYNPTWKADDGRCARCWYIEEDPIG